MRAAAPPPPPDWDAVERLEKTLSPVALERIESAVEQIVEAKQRGGKVAVVTGSGPNIHEGVTTLVAELMRAGIVDGVTTSSAVIAHEMAGVLDRVKRVDGREVGVAGALLPHGGSFELTEMTGPALAKLGEELALDEGLIERLGQAPGRSVIKAAGNLGYPMGLHMERLAAVVLRLAKKRGESFELVAGMGADERTMLGAGARSGRAVLVTIPQLVGGGAVGLAIGDSISISERSERLAAMLGEADVIIESAVALTQEIHDGPFETHTGHGMWAAWDGQPTWSLEGKSLVRIDLDPALEKVWQAERDDQGVQEAINSGQPKTKLFEVPFRMEMSGFARLAGSVAVTGDIGAVWPVMARRLAKALGVELSFVSHPQDTALGQSMREWIVNEIQPMDRERMLSTAG
ncbi:MAG: hypothetical protein QGF56_06345 [Verrucomicrobiota bacterium]|jgi:hypothetical protein|nr:hypothetical protein [Verrucomicrobiota bacterium]MDP6753292.1 hypothetical protein [Verrucomicrobiota bacterium]MDP7013057.1 hypothetical protein [Verrucomicrobiota bacterium]